MRPILWIHLWGLCLKGNADSRPSSSCLSILWIHRLVAACQALAYRHTLSIRLPPPSELWLIFCMCLGMGVCGRTDGFPTSRRWPRDMSTRHLPYSNGDREQSTVTEAENRTAEPGMHSKLSWNFRIDCLQTFTQVFWCHYNCRG